MDVTNQKQNRVTQGYSLCQKIRKRTHKTKIELKIRKEICEEIRARAVVMSKNKRLNCWCAICATAIAKAFDKEGFEAIIRIGQFFNDPDDNHCWVYSEGKNYDVTAQQFNKRYQPIIITRAKNPYVIEMYPNNYEQTNPEQAITYFSDWYEYQQPTEELINKLIE